MKKVYLETIEIEIEKKKKSKEEILNEKKMKTDYIMVYSFKKMILIKNCILKYIFSK